MNKKFFLQEDLSLIFNYLFEKYCCERIVLLNVDTQTLLYKYVKTSPFRVSETFSESVAVKIPETYEDWFTSLSKSTKQNIRTAYNRLKTDAVKLKVFHYDGKIPLYLNRKLMYLQRKRNLEKDGRSYGFMTKLLCYIGSWLSLINPRCLMLSRSQQTFLTYITLNGKIASFVGGFKSNNGRFVIPFLKYNSKFNRYSPGGLVINESIRKMRSLNSFNIQSYDLLTGNEPYKFTYGGLLYQNSNLVVEKRC